MSKYDALWAWIKENGTDSFQLTFAEIEQIADVPKETILSGDAECKFRVIFE